MGSLGGRLLALELLAAAPHATAQIVTTGEQMVVAAELTQAANDSSQREPMVEQASSALAAAGVEQPIGTVLADGGYWNSPQITAICNSVRATGATRCCRPQHFAPQMTNPAGSRV